MQQHSCKEVNDYFLLRSAARRKAATCIPTYITGHTTNFNENGSRNFEERNPGVYFAQGSSQDSSHDHQGWVAPTKLLLGCTGTFGVQYVTGGGARHVVLHPR
jgi:hypothetical protein